MSIKEITELAKTCSEPICKVIDYTLGPIFKPIEKITTTKAECYISNMQKQNEYGLTKKEFQSWKRECFFAEQKQNNMASVLQKAIPNIDTNNEKINSISPDWFMNYREKASLVSNEDLQYLWANILSGEVNSPGTFSLQTISILSIIDKKIAEIIQKLFLFSGYIEDKIILFYDTSYDYPIKYKLNYEDLLDIETLGIIKLSAGNNRFLMYLTPDTNNLIISLGIDKIKILEAKERLFTGSIILTKIGMQIYQLNKNHKRFPELNLEIKKCIKEKNPKFTIL